MTWAYRGGRGFDPEHYPKLTVRGWVFFVVVLLVYMACGGECVPRGGERNARAGSSDAGHVSTVNPGH